MDVRSKRASKAVQYMTEVDPSLAALSIWCRMVDGWDSTMSSSDTITIGEDFDALPMREQIGTLGHHILHVALRHSERMNSMRTRMSTGFNALTYNLAADAIVNEVLHQAGHALQRPAPLLSTLLRDVLHVETDPLLSAWDTDRLYIALSNMDAQGAERQKEYQEKTQFQQDIQPSKTGDSSDDASIDWHGHLRRATGMPGQASRGVGHVLSQVADIPQPSFPWEIHLRRLLAKATSDVPRLSYRRPRNAWIAADASARYTKGPSPVFEPGTLRNNLRKRIVVGLDSSGSITNQMLRLLSAEISGIARRTHAETHVLYFDETVYRQEMVTRIDHAHLDVQREGGTSFVDVLDQAGKLDPSAVVLLTDMDGAVGPRPDFPVIWVTPAADPCEPSFGTVLSLAR